MRAIQNILLGAGIVLIPFLCVGLLWCLHYVLGSWVFFGSIVLGILYTMGAGLRAEIERP